MAVLSSMGEREEERVVGVASGGCMVAFLPKAVPPNLEVYKLPTPIRRSAPAQLPHFAGPAWAWPVASSTLSARTFGLSLLVFFYISELIS